MVVVGTIWAKAGQRIYYFPVFGLSMYKCSEAVNDGKISDNIYKRVHKRRRHQSARVETGEQKCWSSAPCLIVKIDDI